jgi:DNA-binding MarR family transcriptional regulator
MGAPPWFNIYSHRGSLAFLREVKAQPIIVRVLSLHQLTCFLATYEHGSLTAAAEELGYAQPSVSEQIRALEKSLGAPTPSGCSPPWRTPSERCRA